MSLNFTAVKVYRKKIKTLLICLSKIILIALSIALISLFGPRKIFYYEHGLYYGYDLIHEYRLNKILNKIYKNKEMNKQINLQTLMNKKIIKACVQSPYVTQELFEKQIRLKVKSYVETSDIFGYVFWFFLSDGSVSRLRISPEFVYISQDKCSDNNVILSFRFDEKRQDIFNFYFNEID